METSHLSPFRSIFARLRVHLLSEKDFCVEIAKLLSELERYGLRLKVTVKENESVFAEYGSSGSGDPSKCDSVRESSFVFGFSGWTTTGNTPQDNIQAEVTWDQYFNDIRNIFLEHWRCRKAPSGLWCGEDASVDTKRRATVTVAASQRKPIAFVLLDCDGFGKIKDRLDGNEKATEVMQNVARFFYKELTQQCLTFHLHGDEFALIFIGDSRRTVLNQLFQFQANFHKQDFRPSGHFEEIHLGIKIAVSFLDYGHFKEPATAAYAYILAHAEKVDLKNREDREFIEIAQFNSPVVSSISSLALQQAVLWARQGLATNQTTVFKDDLHDLITDILVHHPDETTLSQCFKKLEMRFVLRIYPANEQYAFLSAAKVSASRDIPLTRLAAIMLHVILKRRFIGCGPALEKGKLRICFSEASTGTPQIFAIQQLHGTEWKTLFSYGPIPTCNPISVEAGEPWLRHEDDPDGTKQYLTRWIPKDPELESLSPCLAVMAGDRALQIQPSFSLWAAGEVYIDDRPVISGDLPDFWQRNLARIIVECLRNPNIRTIIFVREDQKAVKKTVQNLSGACTQDSSDLSPTDPSPPWDNDFMGVISSATTISQMQLVHFRDRNIRIHVVDANEVAVLKAAYECFQADAQHLRALGSPDLISWRSDEPNDAPGPGYEFRFSKLSEAYPHVLRALRHKNCPRYMEPRGEKLSELTSVHVHIANPSADNLPEYWVKSSKEFNEYYQRAFAPGSLFGRRLYDWGAKSGQNGSDQVDRAINLTVGKIKEKKVARRIILATPEPPGTTDSDPLGLTAVYVFPRFRGEPKSWYLDFIWVWRSVEAIVGFPFSAHGSVRFSSEFVEKVKANLGDQDLNVRMGELTYIAISMHLYCDPADLAIARHIDLEARP